MTTTPVMSITDEQIAEIEALANGAGGIEWYASTAYCSNADKESLAIYHRPHPFHCVEIVETPDSDPENGECIHSKEYWAFIGSAHPAALLALISRLRAAERDAARYRWLRDRGDAFQWENILGFDLDDFVCQDNALDAAIDEALTAAGVAYK